MMLLDSSVSLCVVLSFSVVYYGYDFFHSQKQEPTVTEIVLLRDLISMTMLAIKIIQLKGPISTFQIL